MRAGTASAVVTAILCAIVASAGPASADEVTLLDTQGDVWRHDGRATTYSPTERVGSVSNADVASMRIRHGVKRVVVEARYTDMVRKTRKYSTFGVILVTDADKTFGISVSFTPEVRDGSTGYWAGDFSSTECEGMRHLVDYRNNFARFSAPRSCFGKPRWIRFDPSTAMEKHDETHAYIHRDDPQSDQAETEELSAPLWRTVPWGEDPTVPRS